MGLNIDNSLDTAHLRQVYGDDHAIIALIFDAFVTDSYTRWQDLKPVLTDHNLIEAASIVHGLKPSFPMAGMTWLRPKVEELEQRIKNKNGVAALMELYQEIDEELDHLIPVLIAEGKRLSAIEPGV
ncbi:hypothetical protein CLV98_11097 [Dyadobacter jejuensis]|uniref:HPt (Histidine-containing phosphotransfer) domain-containing protein n=1 Tax=Dyadobacter jejuensis TaxID=1082580 RepID=A0A316AG79_9BACT|nr:Hpt domain-containing protein [Dyadobacter jejuensis]PWJ56786.1 hypothetical protein CLV98_11097 [Dyadobacter jejuensis]